MEEFYENSEKSSNGVIFAIIDKQKSAYGGMANFAMLVGFILRNRE